jgi:hypothetical protein
MALRVEVPPEFIRLISSMRAILRRQACSKLTLRMQIGEV